MLIVEIIRYLKRRADKRPVYLNNFVNQGHHHGQRTSEPSVAIIIPTRDKVELLRACVESVFEKTTYKNYSIIVVDNQSVESSTLEYLDELAKRGVSVLKYPNKFNYSAICNFAASTTTAEYLCFLNNDTEVIEPNWLSYMIDHAIQPDVGTVGSVLRFSDGKTQHAGVSIGYLGVAGHVANSEMLPGCALVSAVTFACAVAGHSTFDRLGGLDERYEVGLNDIAFGLNLRKTKFKTVICIQSELVHHESATRQSALKMRNLSRAILEVVRFSKDWGINDDDYFGR